jgi:hypothetical protein
MGQAVYSEEPKQVVVEKKSDTIERIKKLKTDYQALVSSEGKKALNELLMDFFATNTDVEALQWTQYTPYFNDGDSCNFSVHEPEVKFFEGKSPKEIAADEDNSDYGRQGFVSRYSIPEGTLRESVRELSNTLSSIEDVLEEALGDHLEVTATRNGVEVSEYSHD